MLRPERMSRVSVTGSKAVMADVVEAIHDVNLIHLSDYDGSWAGFSPGDPVAGADEASEKLVTVRSLESILDVDPEDAGRTHRVTDEEIEEDLGEIRSEVNELDDRRDELESELREIDERLATMAPFADLGIDLDLLSGYDSLQVAVGEGDADAIRETLAADDDVRAFELFTADSVVAAFARPAEDAPEDALTEALVGVEFGELEVPDAEGGPGEYIEELESRKRRIESELDTVENELEDVKLDAAGFLLAVEEKLTIDVQKREAPLSFATTERSFVAEGWVPSEQYAEVEAAVEDAVGDRAAVEELDRVTHEEYARKHAHEAEHEDDESPVDQQEAIEEEEEPAEPPKAATDGGHAAAGAVTMDDDPPVVLDNPGPANPFELLVEMVALPRYDEWDPTVLLFLTFPAFFGFMIGDLGYGILYMAIGYYLWRRMDSDSLRALGGIALWAGGFTALFGILYGEVFGLHQLGELYGGPVMHKGLQPAEIEWALAWIVVSVLAGIVHLAIGFLLSFRQELSAHGLREAVMESGSWLLMLFGLWGWIFSFHLAGPKPDLIVGSGSVFNGHPLPLGFTGLPETAGLVGFGAFVLGLVMILRANPVEFVEALFLQVLVNGMSYTRIAAVLLAKAGMAFVVNLLVFGAYAEETGHGEEFHFLFFSDHYASPADVPAEELVFAGLLNGEGAVALVLGGLFGLLVLVLGHLAVLGLGITSAGLQGVRLEYVEFFSKFYDGGGDEYEPFGHERRFTSGD